MKKSKYWLLAGLALIITGSIGLFFSQLIIEDWLQVERHFGEEPLSIRTMRVGGIVFLAGIIAMVYGGWQNQRIKKHS